MPRKNIPLSILDTDFDLVVDALADFGGYDPVNNPAHKDVPKLQFAKTTLIDVIKQFVDRYQAKMNRTAVDIS